MTEAQVVTGKESSPWYNPQPPGTPRSWTERKKELDTTLWPDVRILATIGHKRMSTEKGGLEGLIPYHQMLQMHRDEVKKTILEHEFKLGWLLPPEPTQVPIELSNQPLTPGPVMSENPAPTAVVLDTPEVQPQPPPVPGRRRRSATQVAPPPAPIVNTEVLPQEVPQMTQLAISPLMPMAPGPTQGFPSEIEDLRRQLAQAREALEKLQGSADRIGKMAEGIGNNGDIHYKLSNTTILKVGELDKKVTLMLTALHHMYMSDPNTLALLQQAGVNPQTIKTVGDFLTVMGKFAGIQYP